MKRALTVTALSVAWCGTAFAGYVSFSDFRGDLREYEKASKRDRSADVVRSGRMMGYVAAVADTLHNGKDACLPEDLDLQKAVALVKSKTDILPEEIFGKVPAAVVIAKAFTDAFPCKR
jgi:hypothetical protein